MQTSKTILMPISNGFAARTLLRAGFIDAAFARGIRLVLLAPNEKRAYYESQFQSPHLQWDTLPPVGKSRAERAWAWCERVSMPTRTAYSMHQSFFRRGGSHTSFPIRLCSFLFRMTLWLFGHSRLYRTLFRSAYSFFSSRVFATALRRYKPDIVFCPMLVYGGEYALLAEAKRRGIKTVGMGASWDNFTSKTFLRVHPARLLVQTEIMKRDAMCVGDFQERRITVVGAAQYDGHIRREGIVSREEFFKTIGEAPEKKLVLFAFSGKASMDADWEALAVLADAFRTGALSRDTTQVLVRPYPKRKFSIPEFARVREQFGFLVEAPVGRVGSGKDAWEFDERALILLRNSIAHADVVITACSTFFVEASLFDTPLVAIAFGPRGADYWNSARRFFEWNHLTDIGRTGGVARAETPKALIAHIRAYLVDQTLHAEGRKRIAAEQAGYTDGMSVGRIIAGLLTS